MKRTLTHSTLATLALAPCMAAVTYNEALQGDLSGNFLNPTPLTLAVGENRILAQMGQNGFSGATNGRDADYFTFMLPAGFSLQSMTVTSYQFAPSDPGVSFAAFTPAAAFAGQGSQHIAGSSFFNAASGNILIDFTETSDPLPSGVYSFWFQETSATTVDYELSLQVIPEPSTTVLSTCGILLALIRRRLD